jgi:pSer/pThr/pTyr-binding forkhead associated (FHA) protein
MDARLKFLFGPSPGQTIPILAGTQIVGRDEDCHVRLPSEFVSHHHCLLLLDEDTLAIRDLGSKNGTFVNSCRVGTGTTILMHGDIVSVGDLVFQIDLAPIASDHRSTAANARPAVSSPALEGTGVFDGDTIEAERPSVSSPPEALPASRPADGSNLPTSSDDVMRTV